MRGRADKPCLQPEGSVWRQAPREHGRPRWGLGREAGRSSVVGGRGSGVEGRSRLSRGSRTSPGPGTGALRTTAGPAQPPARASPAGEAGVPGPRGPDGGGRAALPPPLVPGLPRCFRGALFILQAQLIPRLLIRGAQWAGRISFFSVFAGNVHGSEPDTGKSWVCRPRFRGHGWEGPPPPPNTPSHQAQPGTPTTLPPISPGRPSNPGPGGPPTPPPSQLLIPEGPLHPRKPAEGPQGMSSQPVPPPGPAAPPPPCRIWH